MGSWFASKFVDFNQDGIKQLFHSFEKYVALENGYVEKEELEDQISDCYYIHLITRVKLLGLPSYLYVLLIRMGTGQKYFN